MMCHLCMLNSLSDWSYQHAVSFNSDIYIKCCSCTVCANSMAGLQVLGWVGQDEIAQ